MDYKVLIVEDEQKLRDILCDYFISKGDKPEGAADGKSALELIEEKDYDAVLLDIMMPGLDGFSVCRAVRRKSDVPIVFLTALSDEDDKLKGYELGADDYVTKPFTMSVLYAKVSALIKRSRGSMMAGDRMEAGKVKLAQDDFSLAQMVHDTFEKFETLAAEKELKISLDMKGDLPVTADEARLGQVMINFVSNAVRYTPHGGEIRVRAYQRSRKTLFFIENTGKHFTEEEKQKIWETFYRTDKSRSSKGTGLGLAIAKNIVELHGGKVFVYNTDLGVQFGFEI